MGDFLKGTREFGRGVIEKLPLSPDNKVRLKRAIITLIGLRGVQRASLEQTAVRLAAIRERYRELYGTARESDSATPERSVSIVIPVYNQLSYTLRCIEEIKRKTSEIDHEIIVVDDASTDASEAMLSGRTDITYVRSAQNLGFIGSCNAGARRAQKTYLCFLNNDTAVQPYWLSALVNSFELHKNVGLAGSKLVFPDSSLQEAGGLVWEDGSAWNWGRSRNPRDPRFNYARLADFCSGASLLIPRALFESLGGFDSHYTPAYAEDVDLAFKVRALGLSTIYQPLSEVIHFEGVTSGKDTRTGVKKYQVENLKKLAKRWAPVLSHHGHSENADELCDRGVIGRILVLDQITPAPDQDAGSVAVLEMFMALRDLGYKVTFVPCSNLCDMPPYTDLLGALGLESVLFPWSESVGRHLKSHGKLYDAVVICRPATWDAYIDDVRTYASQAKIIYYACDLHFLRLQREAEVSGAHAKAAAANLAGPKHTELDVIASADVCILHSLAEKQLIEDERPDARVICVPIIFEPHGAGEPREERSGILFVGGYLHPPNVDAVNYYLSDIHPLVRKKLHEVGFTAAGSSPPESLRKLAGQGISVPGYVEDLAPLLRQARVMVAPLRYGAGIKGKILAAMAHGLPVVTTPIGAEGIADGDELIIADDPETFAAAVCRLYSDPEQWHRLQQSGLDFVRQKTSRNVVLRALAATLRQVGLPILPLETAEGSSADIPTVFGSPVESGDIAKLAEAGRQGLAGPEFVDLLLIPNGVTIPDTLPGAIRAAAPHSEIAERIKYARVVVVILDPTDMASVETVGRELAAHLPVEAVCAVIVAPPRLRAGAAGYVMRTPFSERKVDRIELPYHETLEAYFDLSGRNCVWQVDKSMRGFPALSVLRIT